MSTEPYKPHFTTEQVKLSQEIAEMLHARIGMLLLDKYGSDSYERHNPRVRYSITSDTHLAHTEITSPLLQNRKLEILQKSHEWPIGVAPRYCTYEIFGRDAVPNVGDTTRFSVTNTIGVMPILSGFVSFETFEGPVNRTTIPLTVSEANLNSLVQVIENGTFVFPSRHIIGF